MDRYPNRYEAGKILCEYLKDYVNQDEIIVLGLPRGGVPVAFEVAKALHAPLDVFIVRKLGVPGHEELAMGALAMGNVIVFNDEVISEFRLDQTAIENVIEAEKIELARREKAYRGLRPFPNLTNKRIILVDDGIATGATIRAAVKALRAFNPKEIIIAIPVAEINTCEKMAMIADKIVCPMQPQAFYAVGAWYEDFNQTSDEEVYRLLSSQDQTFS